jgi:hypothetical protein
MPTVTEDRSWFVPRDVNGFLGLVFDNLTVLSFLSLFPQNAEPALV